MADDPEREPVEHELVMPFVAVASNGGPFDDQAYAAGWEMGALDALLEHGQPPVHEQPLLTENAAQADLVAMKHGYRAEVRVPEDDDFDDRWRWLIVTRNPEVSHD
jgi:hypothetical protein